MKKIKTLQNYILSIFILLLFWWVLSIIIQKPALPPPHVAFLALFKAFDNDLLIHTGISLFRVVISLALATIFAVPLGLFLGKNAQWGARFAPIIYLTYPIPKVVFLPILLLLLGIGETPKIALIFLVVFYQSLVTIIEDT